jgi:cytochrome P450
MVPSTIAAGHDANASAEPAYPMARTCPFDPPAELAQLRAQKPVSRVRLWDGTSPWLVTRYEDVRSLLADPRSARTSTCPATPPSRRGSSPGARHREASSAWTTRTTLGTAR